MKNPTFREIAAAAGVSASTVSRALANNRRIPLATRQRVRAVAEKMGWKANPLASAYMAHLRSTSPPSYKATLAFLVDYPVDALPSFIATYYQSAAARAATYGYRMVPLSFADRDMTHALMDRKLYNRNVPGFIVSSFRQPGTRITDFNWRRYAMVALGPTLIEPRIDRVAVNYYQGFKQSIDSIYRLGYRRLGIIISRDYDERVDHGLLFPAAYVQQHLSDGATMDTLILDTNTPREVPRIQQWVRQHRPQIVLGVTLARESIAAMGWRIPQDVAFASVDRGAAFPHHAGFDQRHERIGSLAADVLVAQLTNNLRGVPEHYVEHLVEGVWADGETAPPVRPDGVRVSPAA